MANETVPEKVNLDGQTHYSITLAICQGGENMRSFRKKMGKNFVAVGWGRHGPYAVAARRIATGTYGKVSVGTRGSTIGIKHKVGRRAYEIGYNLTTKAPYLRRQPMRRRRRHA